MDIDKIRRQLKDRNLKAVAAAAGLHFNTVYRLANGGTPSLETVQKLTIYLNKR
jgi:DNA-binding phage protein